MIAVIFARIISVSVIKVWFYLWVHYSTKSMVLRVHWLLADDSLQGEDLVFLWVFFQPQDLRLLFSAKYRRCAPADVNFHRVILPFLAIYSLFFSWDCWFLPLRTSKQCFLIYQSASHVKFSLLVYSFLIRSSFTSQLITCWVVSILALFSTISTLIRHFTS